MSVSESLHTNRRNSSPVWLMTATFILLLLPNIWLSIVEPMNLVARICNVLLPGGLYMIAVSALRNPARTTWLLFPLLFLSAFQLVLLYLYGHSIIAVDMFLNLVTTNPAEVNELLGSMLPSVIGVIVIFLPLLCIAAFEAFKKEFIITRHSQLSWRKCGIVLTLIGLINLTACYIHGDYHSRDDLYPVNVCYNMYLAFDRSSKTAIYADTSRDFKFQAVSTHPADSLREVYIFVIGETARAENFGLYGYKRNTTPYLGTDTCIIKYPQAYTQSNTTHKSVPMLLSAACADDYERIYHEKSLITAFREAGYHTAFISNQRPNHSFIDLFGKEADMCEFLKEELPPEANVHDSDMLEVVNEILDSGYPRELIVLHSYGSHFKYNERYPRSMAVYTPDEDAEVKPSNRECLTNAYDNTILYTDLLLHILTKQLADRDIKGGLLYTSDHGENIFDDERDLFLHASPRPSAQELHVPLLIWLSQNYRKAYPDALHNLENNSSRRVLTSASVFHTLIDMAGISTPVLNDTLSLASPRFTPQTYYYLTDRNIPLPVEKAKVPELRASSTLESDNLTENM